jgi:hypothetical protein
MTFLNFHWLIIVFFTGFIYKDSDALFYNWNKASIQSLENSVKDATDSVIRKSYENRLAALPLALDIQDDMLNKESIRWKFIEQINKDFIREGRNWTVIEISKSGEKIRLLNYLIYYDNPKKCTIVKYEYKAVGWQKMTEETRKLKKHDFDLKKLKVPWGTGHYHHDVIITNFKSETVLQSEYFLYTSLADKSALLSLIQD